VIITPKLHTNNGFIQHRNGRKYKPIAVDGNRNYYGSLMSPAKANEYLALLLEIDWKNDQAVMFGTNNHQAKSSLVRRHELRLQLPNTTKKALLDSRFIRAPYWPNHNKRNLQPSLLNPYHDGNEGMSWHSDAEKCKEKRRHRLDEF
jgi:alkylated DNA repair dioxygenase AlkB